MANKYVNMMPSGTNNYLSPPETANRTNTDFWTPGVNGNITNTAGVAPSTGSFAVNAQGSPNMTVAVSSGFGMVKATPTGANQQIFNVRSDAAENVTIANNASGSTVYDFIYILLDATKLNNPSVTGTDVMTFAVQRSTTQYVDSNVAPVNGELIAEVTVANGAVSIANASITDRRREANIAPKTGWTDFNEIPVFVSATTMTVSAGLAAFLSIGDKLRLRQAGTDKYFYVTGISGTTITINGGSDYTLANAVVGKASFSKLQSPTGFPQWFNYSPTTTTTGATIGNATNVGTFTINGRLVKFTNLFTVGSTTNFTGLSSITITLPATANATFAAVTNSWAFGNAFIGGVAFPLTSLPTNSTTLDVVAINAAGTYASEANLTAAIPTAWGVGNTFFIGGEYGI